MAEGMNTVTYVFQISPRAGEPNRSAENLITISEIEAYTGLGWQMIMKFGTSFPMWESGGQYHSSRTAIDTWFIQSALSGTPQ